jgi:hypothetical protein
MKKWKWFVLEGLEVKKGSLVLVPARVRRMEMGRKTK